MKTYTKALCLWAWVEHPGLVPRVRWVTLPGPSSVAPEPGRRGLQRRCIMHLDILEDKTVEEAPMPGKFTWKWGVVDGERLMRDRAERLLEGDISRGGGRRDDEDDDHLGRRGRDGSRGWRETLRRSLSRGAGLRARDASQDGQRHRDRSSHREGGRRHDAGLQLLLPSQVFADIGFSQSDGQVPLLTVVAPATDLVPATDTMHAGGQDGHTPGSSELGMPRSWGFGLGSGDALDAVLDGMPRRQGRSRARSASPRATRRRSRAALTPPSTPDPPSSPTSVIPSSPSAKGRGQDLLLVVSSEEGTAQPLLLSPRLPSSDGARLALAMLAPDALLDTSPASRPPGFEATPEPRTPPFICDGSPARTPEPAPRTPRLPAPTAEVVAPVSSVPLAPLFVAVQPALLSPPMSSPPVRPVDRRKTLAGADITRTVGFSLRKATARSKQRRAGAPVAKKAEAMVCKGLGIIKDGEEVTEWAMAEFAQRFKGRVAEEVLDAMMALFKVGSEEDDAIDEAMLAHGGAAALDFDRSMEGTATADA